MDKEDLVHICNAMEYYSAIKKNKIMPFAATWMDMEIIILSEARQRQVSYAIAYMQNLKKNGTNELIYKTETDSQTSGMKFWVPGLGVGED